MAGTFGSALLVNSGGVMADLYRPRERGMAVVLFAAAVFIAPVLGPLFGGYVGDALGWRWLLGILAIINAGMLIFDMLFCPETYGPVLLR